MYPSALRLRSGRKQLCVLPAADPDVQNLFAHLRGPVPDDPRILRLRAPHGRLMEIPARDILGLELEPPYALVENFLAPAELDEICTHAITRESSFESAVLSLSENEERRAGADYRFRRARILNDVNAVAPIVLEKLKSLIPRLWDPLDMAPIPLQSVECQMTAHGDGDFFNTHTDNGLPDIAHRKISYVYYFHREPKVFSGGLLRLYKTLIANGEVKCGEVAADIDPPRNGLMVFPSHIYHEVTPITSPSTAFADSRLTLNGWII